MPLRMICERGYEVPAIFCDHCGERIPDGDAGNFHWDPDLSATKDGAPLEFTHKQCCWAYDHSSDDLTYVQEIRILVALLVDGLKVKVKAARDNLAFQYYLVGSGPNPYLPKKPRTPKRRKKTPRTKS